jgi:hypothetical protein
MCTSYEVAGAFGDEATAVWFSPAMAARIQYNAFTTSTLAVATVEVGKVE